MFGAINPMSAILAWNCGWRPNSCSHMKTSKRIMKFLANSDFEKAVAVARNEIKAYAYAVSGPEVVGKAT